MALLPTLGRRGVSGIPSVFDSIWGDDIFDMTNRAAQNTTLPAVNIKENKDEYTLEVAAPGLNKDDFNVTVDNGSLVISSEKEEKNEEGGENNGYARREFRYQSFKRSFTLPEDVKEDKISADYKEGVLNVHVPKAEEAKSKETKKIDIK